jgi:hypothetical protein
LKMLV